MFRNFRGKNFCVKIFSWSGSHQRLLLLVLPTKVTLLGPVNHPCTAGIAVEPFWPRSAVLHLHIRRLYNVLLFVVKNISCDKFLWFEPSTRISRITVVQCVSCMFWLLVL